MTERSKDAARGPTITCSPNGPYVVRGLGNLRNSRGEPLDTQRNIALCRCGGSANKPFCDGTHSKIGFTSARERSEAPSSSYDEYPGRDITVLDNRTVCAHAGHCTDGLPAVFRMDQEPWIDPDGADPEAVTRTVRACPSGALSYAIQGIAYTPDATEPGITVSKNGPYWVVGGLRLVDEVTGQQPQSATHYALCRCGHSRNKPFCDGAHWDAGFRDDKN